MSKKQPRVPGMRTPNRAERRGKAPAADAPITRDEQPPPQPDVERIPEGRDLKKTNVANQYR
jgi:hypothetical protein